MSNKADAHRVPNVSDELMISTWRAIASHFEKEDPPDGDPFASLLRDAAKRLEGATWRPLGSSAHCRVPWASKGGAMKVQSRCLVCGKVFEKSDDGSPDPDSIAERMVSYLALRHREKTGHATSPIVKDDDRLPPIHVTLDVKKLS